MDPAVIGNSMTGGDLYRPEVITGNVLSSGRSSLALRGMY
jgi:hypothetical protein